MTVKPRSLAFAIVLAALPVGFALGAGGGAGSGAAAGSAGVGAGATGAGVGAAGMGGAAVGGGAPAGRVGGGPPAGAVGGGAPGSNNPAGNGAAGTGDPGLNAAGTVPPDNPASGLENAPTTGGVIGGNTGVPPIGVGASPPVTGQTDPVAPKRVEGIAEQPPSSTVGRVEPGTDGGSSKITPKPCGVAAHETDGTTTCIGIPAQR
jgi:hypothetical protein